MFDLKWPSASPIGAFAERRKRLELRVRRPALIAAGVSSARNLPRNRHPFRATSHFLYFVGAPLEGAVLRVEPGRSVLYVPQPDPDAALWSGPQPSLEELANRLAIEVRPLEELAVDASCAVLPPQDWETALWLEQLVGREVEPGGGDTAQGIDAELADVMIELRLRHDAAAMSQLRQAAALTVRAHLAGMRLTRVGLREAAVCAAMRETIFGCGMTLSYAPIVTVRGEILHNEQHDGLLGHGDLLLADVGAETAEGWAADVTRTWPVNGRFSATQRVIYEAVLEAQRAAIDAVRPGVRFLDVHRIAGRRLLAALIELGIFRGSFDELYERGAAGVFFPHGVGHLIGLDVHDMEDLGDRAGYAPGRVRSSARGDRFLRLDRDLEAGMAVTIEPGFYRCDAMLNDDQELGELGGSLNRDELAKFSDVRGIRIEDDVLVTDNGSEVLTASAPRDAEDVEAAVGGRS